MTPKEKALELVIKYNTVVLDTALGGSNKRVKKCALIAVDELINAIEQDGSNHVGYWLEVEKEIEKL